MLNDYSLNFKEYSEGLFVFAVGMVSKYRVFLVGCGRDALDVSELFRLQFLI